MTKTASDVVALALRNIGVTPVDEEPQADEAAYALGIYEAEFGRLKADHGFSWTWTHNTVPDELLVPMSMFVASGLVAFDRPLPSQARAIGMLRSYAFPDDREDPADTDEDGTVTEAERAAADRAAYY